jgi:hypothetical protein
MAIKHSEFIQISGRVGKSFHAKNGIALTIEVSREGLQYPTKYTAWEFPQPVPAQGDSVTVKGWFSSRKTVKEDKTYIDFSINKPILVEHERAAVVAAEISSTWDTVAPASASAEVWHEPGAAL